MYIVAGFLGMLIWAVVLSAIISDSTKTKRNMKLQQMQTKLLSSIALKLGVNYDEVASITKGL